MINCELITLQYFYQPGLTIEEMMLIITRIKLTKDRLSRNVDFLAGQISMLEQSAIREEEKINDMKLKCEMFRFLLTY